MSSNQKFWGKNPWFWNIKITHKILANFASLNSSIARGALRSRRCLRARGPQAPAESQVSKRNTRIKRRKFRKDFWVILTDGSRGTETSHESPTMDLRVCQMKRREEPHSHSQLKKNIYKATCFLIMRYYFSHDHASFSSGSSHRYRTWFRAVHESLTT